MMLWQWDNQTERWRAHALQPGKPFSLSPHALLLPLAGKRCGLMVREEVMVNGLPSLPLHMLVDRDEIRVGRETVYFSTESAAEIVLFAGQGKEISCGRCKGKLKEEEASIQCPRCQAWHHQTEALPCWMYDAKCSSCEQPTTGISWQPEPLRRRSGWEYDDQKR